MKKLLVFMFALMILFSVAACDAGKKEQTNSRQDSTATPEKVTEPEVVPTQTQPAETEPTIPTEPEATEYPVPPETNPEETEPEATEPVEEYAFPGMPEGYVLSEEELAMKAELVDDGTLSSYTLLNSTGDVTEELNNINSLISLFGN